MRFLVLSLSSLLLSSCAHNMASPDNLALDQETEAVYSVDRPTGFAHIGNHVTLIAQPDLVRMALALGVERGAMVEWGMRCGVDMQYRLIDCQVVGITPEFADKGALIAPFLNGLSVSRFRADISPDRVRFVGRFHLRNAVAAPLFDAPCHAGSLCPVIHTWETVPPPPPPPPPAAPQ